MAIEIIPKERFQIPVWTIIILTLCLIIFLGLSSSYFYFYQSLKKISQEITNKEEALKMTPSEIALDKDISIKEKKINNFSSLASAHRKSFNVFSFLERVSHPQISFNDFNFNSSKDTVTIKGEVASFIALGQQFLILKQENVLRKINLSEVSISQEGKIKFSLQLIFNPQIFK